MLRLAAANLRLQGQPLLPRLQNDLDELHRALEAHRQAEGERLQAQKLRALAEFAAGAGHEINNPLAVISGQAQYLLRKVTSGQWAVGSRQATDGSSDHVELSADPCPLTTALETIISQAQRIHLVLRDLMQFARPPEPRKQVFDLGILVREVATALQDEAAQRPVQLQATDLDGPVWVDADMNQVRTALTCLVRNAIEAAPTGPEGDGWVSIRLLAPTAATVEVLVEDNGPGPAAAQREHLFDPFYSGRAAGRGRGLGLPTAWRLARQHGGDVQFSRPDAGPTRFTLTLPRLPANNGSAAA
jgi:signal transduction histidine kinase